MLQFLIRVLELVKPPVKPAVCEQLVVRPAFPQLAMMEHDYAVAFLNSRKPVGHDQGGSARHHAFNCLLNELLGLGIDRTCRLIEY